MINNYLTKFVDLLVDRKIGKKEDRDIIIYGLMSGIKLLLNIVTTIILGAIFGLILESLIFLIFFSLIRSYTGGYHAERTLSCYIFSSLVIVAVLLAIRFTPQMYILFLNIVIMIIAIPIILKFAPVDALLKPLDNIERKHFRKKGIINLFIECILVFIFYAFKQYKFSYIITLGILVSALLIIIQIIINKNKYSLAE